MTSATYIGPRKNLQGKVALIMDCRGDNSKVRAQFNDMHLASRGALLGFNWHRFDRGHFRFIRQ